MSRSAVDKLAALRDDEARDWVARLCRTMRETLGAERVSVVIYDRSARTISPYTSDNPNDPTFQRLADKWSHLRLEDVPAIQSALREGKPVAIEDVRNDARLPREVAADYKTSSVHFEPLIAAEPVGVLAVEPASAASREQLRATVPLLAARLTRVIEWSEANRRRSEAEFLLELTEAAMGEQSLGEILATICERLAQHMHVRRACVFLLENGRMVPRMARYADGSRDPVAWQKFRRTAVPLPAVEAVMSTGDVVVAEEPGSPLITGWWADTFKLASAVAVPVGKSPEVIGVLTLDAATPRRFSPDEIRLVAAVGSHIAGIIERAQASEQRKAHLRAATAIRRLLEEGSRAVSVEQAGEVLARVTRDALGAEHASLYLSDEEERIGHVITVGVPGRFETILREQLQGSAARDFRIWRLTTRQPKPVFVENARKSRLLPSELVDILDLQSYVALPLLSADRPLGLVICSHARESRHWSNEERQLVAQLALEGSLVVENASLRAIERKRIDELAHQAFHDPLTKLPNRILFADRLQHALARNQRREESVAVLFLDLDFFKHVNDGLGHEAGDQLLISVSERLVTCLRPEDTTARLGGDEFTVLLEDVMSAREAARVAERVAECLRPPFVLEGREISVTTSIGIALSDSGQLTPGELLRRADVAMYTAKREGKDRYELFDPDAYDPVLGYLEDESRALP